MSGHQSKFDTPKKNYYTLISKETGSDKVQCKHFMESATALTGFIKKVVEGHVGAIQLFPAAANEWRPFLDNVSAKFGNIGSSLTESVEYSVAGQQIKRKQFSATFAFSPETCDTKF